MAVHQAFHLRRPYLETGRIDHAFDPVDDEEVALFVDVPQVSGAEEAFAIQLQKNLLCLLRTFPVTLKHLRAMGNDFAHFALRQFLAGFHIDDARIDIKHRDPQTLGLGTVGGIDVSAGNGFGQAIAFHVTQAGKLEEFVGHRRRHGCPAATDIFQRRQVVVFHFRIGQQIDGHGDNVHPAAHLVALDQLGRHPAVPTGHQYNQRTAIDGRIHRALHAGHMEVRQRGQGDRLGGAMAPHRPLHAGGHHRRMGMHATLGRTGGPRAIGEDRQIVRADQQFAGLPGSRDNVLPGQVCRIGQRSSRRFHLRRQGQVRVTDDVIAVSRHNQVAQIHLAHHRRNRRQQLLTANRHRGFGILQIVLQLRRPVHGVHRHHNGVGPQDRVVTDNELGGVLHEQQHPVALFHPQ